MPGFVLDGAAPDEKLRWEGKCREGCFHPPLRLLSRSRLSSDLHLQFSTNYEKSPHNGIKVHTFIASSFVILLRHR